MINLLQIESPRPNGITPETTWGIPLLHKVDYAPFQEISQHASEVAALFYGPDSIAIKSGATIDSVSIMELTSFAGKKGVGASQSNPTPPIWPINQSAHVINISAGMVSNNYIRGIDRLDEMISRDNVVCVVALPNEGQHQNEEGAASLLFSLSQNSIVVGSTSNSHHNWINDTPNAPQRRADILVDQPWTSWCAPVVSSLAAAIIYKFQQANRPYSWSDIKDIILSSATPSGQDKILNPSAALSLTNSILSPSMPDPSQTIKDLESKLSTALSDLSIAQQTISRLESILNTPLPSIPTSPSFIPITTVSSLRKAIVGLSGSKPLSVLSPHQGSFSPSSASIDRSSHSLYVSR